MNRSITTRPALEQGSSLSDETGNFWSFGWWNQVSAGGKALGLGVAALAALPSLAVLAAAGVSSIFGAGCGGYRGMAEYSSGELLHAIQETGDSDAEDVLLERFHAASAEGKREMLAQILPMALRRPYSHDANSNRFAVLLCQHASLLPEQSRVALSDYLASQLGRQTHAAYEALVDALLALLPQLPEQQQSRIAGQLISLFPSEDPLAGLSLVNRLNDLSRTSNSSLSALFSSLPRDAEALNRCLNLLARSMESRLSFPPFNDCVMDILSHLPREQRIEFCERLFALLSNRPNPALEERAVLLLLDDLPSASSAERSRILHCAMAQIGKHVPLPESALGIGQISRQEMVGIEAVHALSPIVGLIVLIHRDVVGGSEEREYRANHSPLFAPMVEHASARLFERFNALAVSERVDILRQLVRGYTAQYGDERFASLILIRGAYPHLPAEARRGVAQEFAALRPRLNPAQTSALEAALR